MGQREDLYFNVMLRDTTPGERRLVNHSLDVAYKDASRGDGAQGVGSLSSVVLSSSFDCSIGTERQVYRMGEDVVIFCFYQEFE